MIVSGSAVSTNGTWYAHPMGGFQTPAPVQTSYGPAHMISPARGIISELFVECTIAPVTNPVLVTLFGSGVPSNLSASILIGNNQANSDTDAVMVLGGDQLSISWADNDGIGFLSWSFIFTPLNPWQQ